MALSDIFLGQKVQESASSYKITTRKPQVPEIRIAETEGNATFGLTIMTINSPAQSSFSGGGDEVRAELRAYLNEPDILELTLELRSTLESALDEITVCLRKFPFLEHAVAGDSEDGTAEIIIFDPFVRAQLTLTLFVSGFTARMANISKVYKYDKQYRISDIQAVSETFIQLFRK